MKYWTWSDTRSCIFGVSAGVTVGSFTTDMDVRLSLVIIAVSAIGSFIGAEVIEERLNR